MRKVKRLVALACAWVAVFAEATAQDYSGLAKKLQRYPEVRSSSRDYLNRQFVYDPSLRRPAGETAEATSGLQGFGYKGLPIQKDLLLLQLRPDADVGSLDELLSKYDLTPRSGIPEIGLLVVEMGPKTPAKVAARAATEAAPEAQGTDVRALKETVQALRQEPIVRMAAVNTLLSPSVVPRPSASIGTDVQGKIFRVEWPDNSTVPVPQRRDGCWGQKAVRFPAAWNFNDAIRVRGSTAIRVGVVDVGFALHEDLAFDVSPVTPLAVNDHGNHVAGIIGAKFDNGLGVNGGAPFVRVTVCTARTVTGVTELPAIYPVISDVIASLVQFILNTPDLKAINLSLGYNWVPNLSRNPNTDAQIEDLVKSHGVIVRAIADLAAERDMILVSAAGNDTRAGFPDIRAEFASPFNWAALNRGISDRPARNIIVVESIGRTGAISPFSNVRGCLSAPGEQILSTVAHDDLGQVAADRYAVMNGTSMAAPQVTALIALMYAYNPELTMDQVLGILDVRDHNRPAATTPAPTIDAFEALLRCRDRSLNDLADLNNDGRVDMGDFRLFRAAVRQVEGRAAAAERADLNGDGVIWEDENVWPRADLNGSGRLSREPGDRRRVKGEDLSDLEVMMKVWEDASVPANQLPTMLD